MRHACFATKNYLNISMLYIFFRSNSPSAPPIFVQVNNRSGVCVCVCLCVCVVWYLIAAAAQDYYVGSINQHRSHHIYTGLAKTIYIYTVYIRYFWQGNDQLYGHIWRIYPILANLTYASRFCFICLRACMQSGHLESNCIVASTVPIICVHLLLHLFACMHARM